MTKRKVVEELPHPILITAKPINVFDLPFELLRDPSWQISTWYRVNAQSRALEKAWADIAALEQQVATLKEELKEAEEDRDEHFEIAECMLSGHDYMDSINGVVTVPAPISTSQTSAKPPMPEQRSLPVTEDENLDPVLRASHIPKNFVVPTIEPTSSPPLSVSSEDDHVAETHDDRKVGEQQVGEQQVAEQQVAEQPQAEHDVEERDVEESEAEESEAEEQEAGDDLEVVNEQEVQGLGAGGYYAAEQQFEDEEGMGLDQKVMEHDVGEQEVMEQDVGEQVVVAFDGEEEDDLNAAMIMSMEM
ncbi:hypothetical protein LTR97_010351 [Elasticomyces elasticus]|uniref:Uncharacterized protein n=1 Tax=Elasticomyces elasticus TaxID=574655 RepID=A0AAN7VTY3_9PEZI|nr:hypothetical protein LTR97_010351 [Elasticomyces elasticus]